MRRWLGLALITAALATAGCSSVVHERHHYVEYADDGVTPVNFYRLTVDGSTSFTSSRFLSGFYDERAVDLFFNERQAPVNSRLFPNDQKPPGTTQPLTPLDPDTKHGAYLLILSSNADAVADAIGNFADSELMAEAVSNLLSASSIEAKQVSDANLAVQKAQGVATWTQLNSQIADADAATDAGSSTLRYLRILTTLARSLGYDDSFSSFEEARKWFSMERSGK